MVRLEVSVGSHGVASDARPRGRGFVASRIPIFRTPRKNVGDDALKVEYRRRNIDDDKSGDPSPGRNSKNSPKKAPTRRAKLAKSPKRKLSFKAAPPNSTKSIKNVWSQKLERLEENSTRSPRRGKNIIPISKSQEIQEETHESPSKEIQGFKNVALEEDETLSKDSGMSSSESATSSISDVSTSSSGYEGPRIRAFRSFLGLIKQRTMPMSLFSLMLFRKSRGVHVRYSTLENTCRIEEEEPTEILWIQKDVGESSTKNQEEDLTENLKESSRYEPKEEDVIYFKNLLQDASRDLASRCTRWDVVLDNDSLDENITGDIRTVIGQAQLLMSERFSQFDGLVHRFENPCRKDKVIVKDDLEGFWEMISFQIQDVRKKFEELKNLKENHWKKAEIPAIAKPSNLRKPTKIRSSKSQSKLTNQHKEEAKNRLREAKKTMKERSKKHDCLCSKNDFTQKLIIK